MATNPENEVTILTNNTEEGNERLPVVLAETEEEPTFVTTARSLEDIPIKEIIHFTLIPDYVIPTSAVRPVIVRTEKGNFCIEGWPLIEDARSGNRETIVCEVDELNYHDDEELCLLKGGIRTLTRGGICTYAEMIRNTRGLLEMLLSVNDDLYIYGHGEKSYINSLQSNLEEDARYILSLRLGRDRDTINQYLCHGEYLSNEVLQIFIDRKASKEFFIKAQVKKRIEIKNQRGINLSNDRITAVISPFMLEAFENFMASREVGVSGQTPTVVAPENENGTQTSTEDNTPARNNGDDEEINAEFATTEGDTADFIPEINPEEPVTIETIKTGALNVSKRLVEHMTKDVQLVEIENSLKAELYNITKLLNLIALLNRAAK